MGSQKAIITLLNEGQFFTHTPNSVHVKIPKICCAPIDEANSWHVMNLC